MSIASFSPHLTLPLSESGSQALNQDKAAATHTAQVRLLALSGDALFILGAQDVEMREIERTLAGTGLPYAHACRSSQRCHSGSAYMADSAALIGKHGGSRSVLITPGAPVALVECHMARASIALRIDHHNPGDPGYEAPPSSYLSGSSLGQLLDLLGLEASADQRLLAAADHCLTAAYAGLCPGVDPDDLLFMRAAWQALMSRRSLGDTMTGILDAASLAKRRYDPDRGACFFLDPTRIPRDLPEGAARAGVPVVYRGLALDGSLKEMIKGARPAAIENFMAQHQAQGRRVYGNPHRGYAGAYLN
jgi:hypothetical protein